MILCDCDAYVCMCGYLCRYVGISIFVYCVCMQTNEQLLPLRAREHAWCSGGGFVSYMQNIDCDPG